MSTTTVTTTDAAAAAAAPLPVLDNADKAPALFRDSLGWYLGVSAYWFAVSFKWFILFLLLPIQVGAIVPGGAKNSVWGLVVALGAAEAMIGPALFGYLSDRSRSRWGRRRPFIAIGAALTALALLFLGQASALWMMIAGYLFLQISDDIATGPYAALVPDLVPENKRGRASGVLSLLQQVAQIVAAVVGIALGANFFAIYAVIAVINVVCALVVLALIRESVPATTIPPAAAVQAPQHGDRRPLVRLARGARRWGAPWQSADFRWVWFTRFLSAFGFYLILLYVVNYLDDRVRTFALFGGVRLAKSFEAAVAVALVISLSAAISAVLAGRLADRVGRKRVIVLSGWLMFVVLAPFAFVPVYAVIVPLAAVFGLGYGAYLSASWALAADVLPSKEDTAKDMGIWQMSVATPQVLTGLAGLVVDFGNRQQPGLGYTLAFLLAAFAFLGGSLLVTRVRGSS